MPKDFAKKKQPRKNSGASRQPKKSSSPIILWLFVILLAIGFASGLIYLKWFQSPSTVTSENHTKPSAKSTTKEIESNKKVIDTSKNTATKKETKSTPQTKAQEEIPLYDLHEDLTNKEVNITNEELSLPENTHQYTYTMPCGSFRENYRAEELKAQIAMTGNKSNIKAVTSKNEIWYRVELGPFNKKRVAESIRHRLQDNNINGCIINRHLIK